MIWRKFIDKKKKAKILKTSAILVISSGLA